ncbi:MAG: replication initiation factor domain-containing protein [Colwellia sp.]|uniref:replication initiation factor domain-containing protein n=1 Tax=Alteromonadales TaxID=135622 RepID=UPI001D86EC07|nr:MULTISPECIES: replication initiation factor domain-containing protein [Alteromonadales]NQZ27435.1 replication initiation factor domain-containing protein [Colwellia sp.]NRA80336.1 replication initiation factor domain-containing protein [Pseudoalteromonas sp.]
MLINPLTERVQTTPKIINKAFDMTTFSTNRNKTHRSEENVTDQTRITDCVHLTHHQIKSRIDYLTIQLKPTTDLEFQLSSEVLVNWLNKIGLKAVLTEPNLKYFDQGCLLQTIDATQKFCGAIKWNDTHDLIQLELTGVGCTYANTHIDYFFIFEAFAKSMEVQIKRIDIAVDTFEKKHGLRFMQQAYSRGLYSANTGVKPQRGDISSDSGKSMVIGSRHSSKQIIGYEKGKQLRYPEDSFEYKYWFRFEVRLRARKSQPIPFDALFNPDEFFVGAYPKANRRLIRHVTPRVIKREVIKATDKMLSDKLAYAKHQVGKTIFGAVDRGLTSEVIVQKIIRKGKKDNLCYPSFITENDKSSYIFN